MSCTRHRRGGAAGDRPGEGEAEKPRSNEAGNGHDARIGALQLALLGGCDQAAHHRLRRSAARSDLVSSVRMSTSVRHACSYDGAPTTANEMLST